MSYNYNNSSHSSEDEDKDYDENYSMNVTYEEFETCIIILISSKYKAERE
jgi:hypothetical protein